MNIFTHKFLSADLEKLKSFFENENCKFSTQQYTFFKATTTEYSASFYTSGKLVIQGKDVSGVVTRLNEKLKMSFPVDKKEANDEIQDEFYIGVDESGKGDFFGPLVIGGVAINSNLKKIFMDLGVKDSKQLDDEKILKLAIEIKKNAKTSVIAIGPKRYNELYSQFRNLNKLLAWGHARVIENVLELAPECTLALSDKFAKDDKVIENALLTKGKQIKMLQRTKGENDIAVAAASIIARAEYVKKMQLLSNTYEIDFPKGASDKVITCAKKYAETYGKNRLNEVAKTHFKTMDNLT